jgi:hypothetical protein
LPRRCLVAAVAGSAAFLAATAAAESAVRLADATDATGPRASMPTRLGSKLPPRLGRSVGRRLYVSPQGADSGRCSFRSPCRSLERAFRRASSGTTIYVRGGKYGGEHVLRDRRFSFRNPVTVSAYPGETPVFVGDPSPAYYGYPAIFVFNVTAVRLRGLEISNPNGDGIKVENSASVELSRLFVHNSTVMGVYVGGVTFGQTQTYSQDIQIWNSTFTMNGGAFPGNEAYASKGTHSIYYGGGPLDGRQHGAVGGVIANNVIYDQATGKAIQLGESAWYTIVTNNTIDHAYQSGWGEAAGNAIQIFNDGAEDFPSCGIVVVNNILGDNYSHAVYGSGAATMTSNVVRDNLGFNNGFGDYKETYGTIQLYTLGENYTADPLFADLSAHDFRLRPGSPAIGVGDAAYMPQIDIAGFVRQRLALGAYAG